MVEIEDGNSQALEIRTRNVTLDEPTEQYARRKFDRLARHLPSMTAAELEISSTSAKSAQERVIAQLTVVAGGRSLRGQERGSTVRQAVDLVSDVLDRQIRRYKTRFYRSSAARRAARADRDMFAEPEAGPALAPEPDSDEPSPGKVIRNKVFAMAPMHVEDAIEEMEMLSHSFFLFYNLESRSYGVVYRRRDGDYGLLEPKLVD